MASATPELTKEAAEARLIEKVAYPAFFEKLASAGYDVADPEAVRAMAGLSDVVSPAVALVVDGYLKAASGGRAAAVKLAADSALAIAGLDTPVPTETPSATFLTDPDVKSAAAVLVAELLKAANIESIMGGAAPRKMEASEEEDEEEGKPKKKVVGENPPEAMPGKMGSVEPNPPAVLGGPKPTLPKKTDGGHEHDEDCPPECPPGTMPKK
jgi:hypothetical protein